MYFLTKKANIFRKLKYSVKILFIVSCFCHTYSLFAQRASSGEVSKDSTLIKKDSIPVRDIKTTIIYSAKDSIRFNVIKQKVYLYGDAKVTYGEIALKAYKIEIDWKTSIVKATGRRDTLKNEEVDLPVFTDKGVDYKAKEMTYNFKTLKGIINSITTKQGDGFIVGERVKKDQYDNLFMGRGIYTTCDLPHPHFGIRAKKIKVIPGKLVVASMFNLELMDIPLPLGFPFGMFPQPKKRASGFVMPQYGETRERGFFLSQGGFYFAISDYVDMQILGEIHSRGGWGATMQSNYLKKYAFNGNFSFRYNRRVNEIPGSLESNIVNDFNVTWSHTPQSKGNGRFSANVNAGTNSFNRNNSFQPNNFLQSSFNSSVNYTYNFPSLPFTFSASLRHTQNIITKIVDIAPDVNLTMQRQQPFKSKTGKKTLLSELSFSYTMTGRATVTNLFQGSGGFPSAGGAKFENVATRADTVAFNFQNLSRIFQNTRMGMEHTIPLSTSVTVLKYITMNINASYKEVWYPEKYSFTPTKLDSVRIDTLRGFSRFNDYNGGLSMQTRLYAFYYPKSKKIEAIRHVINPSLSLSYTPDFSAPVFGFYQQVPIQTRQLTNTGEVTKEVVAPIPRFNGIYSTPRRGEAGTISFNLTNTLEAKLRKSEDDTASKKPAEKIMLLDNFGFTTSYNMIADSFKLAPISLNARTRLFKKFDINFSATLDPYTFELQSINPTTGNIVQRKIDKYAWQTGNGIGNLTNANVAISTNFKPPSAKKEYKDDRYTEEELAFINANRNLYVEFDVPWTLNISYNFSYIKQGFEKSNIVQTLNFNGDVSITKKWKVGFNSGYDFVAQALSFTQFNISRDLHCWAMTATWIPFGPRAGYTVDINVKSALLRDLKLSRRNSWYFR